MQIYNYNPTTFEFIIESEAALDPMETEIQGQDVFLLPAHATFVEAPVAGDNEVAVFDEDTETWSLEIDHRGDVQYDVNGVPSTVNEIGAEPTVTDVPPTEGLLKPLWDGGAWVEDGIVYRGRLVETKADVDAITEREIVALGEGKAKTLKLLAGGDPCPEWDAFVAARNDLVDEGDQFIIDNGLV
jgi:hypothetical protein